MLQETELWQSTVLSHSFQQKLTEDLGQKKTIAWNKLWR